MTTAFFFSLAVSIINCVSSIVRNPVTPESAEPSTGKIKALEPVAIMSLSYVRVRFFSVIIIFSSRLIL